MYLLIKGLKSEYDQEIPQSHTAAFKKKVLES